MADATLGYKFPTCRELRLKYRGLHIKVAAIVSLVVLIVGAVCASTFQAWWRLTEPVMPALVSARVVPIGAGWKEMLLLVNSAPSPWCTRQRFDLLERVESDGLPIYHILGFSMSGLGMGHSGVYMMDYAVPPMVRGKFWLHTRFLFTCPLGPVLPPRTYWVQAPDIQVEF